MRVIHGLNLQTSYWASADGGLAGRRGGALEHMHVRIGWGCVGRELELVIGRYCETMGW